MSTSIRIWCRILVGTFPLGLLTVAVLTASAGAADRTNPVLREAPQRLTARGLQIGELVADLSVTTVDGQTKKLSEWNGDQGLVIAVHSVECPVSKKFVPALKRMAAEYAKQGFSFLLVNPMENESKEEISAFRKTYELELPYAMDTDHHLGLALGFQTTTEAFVLDRARTLVYRGAVSDQYGIGYALDAPKISYLTMAMNAVLAKTRPRVEATTAPGCALDLGDSPVTKKSTVTYHNRISRLIQGNCQECHRPGESAPFDLLTYDDVKGHRAMIRRVLERKSMPPWFASDEQGPFINDRTLSEDESSDFLSWLNSGLEKGDAADAPIERDWVEGWRIGTPDKIVKLPLSIPVPAEGTIPYKYVTISNKFDEDCWVEAMEIRPTAPENVHHVLVFLQFPPGHPRAKEQRDYQGGQRGFFAGMVPGQNVTAFAPGLAKFIPKGASLQFQLHYTTNGLKTKDKTRLGLKFAKKKPLHEVKTIGITQPRFIIPPMADNHKVETIHRLSESGRILGFMPHMHLRGKSFRFALIQPDGTEETILDVPHYDFNWQFVYELEEPIEVVAGTRLRVTGWFDNSDKNPANPDPNTSVRFGEQTWEEMMIGYLTWVPTGP